MGAYCVLFPCSICFCVVSSSNIIRPNSSFGTLEGNPLLRGMLFVCLCVCLFVTSGYDQKPENPYFAFQLSFFPTPFVRSKFVFRPFFLKCLELSSLRITETVRSPKLFARKTSLPVNWLFLKEILTMKYLY